MTNFLVNVPTPLLFEAASSWLSRLALSQGIGLTELMDFLGIKQGDRLHLDRVVNGAQLLRILALCKLPENSLQIQNRVSKSLEKLDPDRLAGYLLAFNNKATFRFCPACFREMRMPHVPIHWRFMAWRWCPVHDCLMEAHCPQCGQMQRSPINLALTDCGKNGLPVFNRCQYCSHSLGKSSHISTIGMSREDRAVLSQGRAFLATLFHGHFGIKGTRYRRDVRELGAEFDLIPFTQEILSLSTVWRREWMLNR